MNLKELIHFIKRKTKQRYLKICGKNASKAFFKVQVLKELYQVKERKYKKTREGLTVVKVSKYNKLRPSIYAKH